MASNIDNLNGFASARLDQIARSSQERSTRAEFQAPNEPARTLDRNDSVELSAEALNADSIRADLVTRVRAEIEAGTYETDAKLDSAAQALAKQLGI